MHKSDLSEKESDTIYEHRCRTIGTLSVDGNVN